MSAALVAWALLALSATGLGAQSTPPARAGSATITGTLLDAADRTPVVGALVRLVEASRADLSHSDGSFSFRNVPANSYWLRVTRLGFRPESVQVDLTRGEPRTVEIQLRAAAIELAPTVVTGGIRAQEASRALSPTTVLAGAQLDRQLQGTIAATLQNQPGMSVVTMGPATARPVIRGLSGDRVVMLEDGMRPGDLASTSADHAVTVEPVATRQLEVVRGPMSLLYGSSALGGVVNVLRDEVPVALPEHVAGVVSLTGSSVDGGIAAGGVVNARAGSRGAIRAEGTGRRAGDQRTPLGTLDNTALETFGASVGASVVGARSHVGGSYRFFDNSYGVPGGFVGGHALGVHINMRRQSVRAEAERRIDGALWSSARASASATRYRHEELEAGGSLGTRFSQTLAQGDVLARHAKPGSTVEGAVGARFQYRDIVTGGALRTPSTYDHSAAAFAVEQWTVGPLTLVGGARYDWARFVPYERGAVVIVNDQQLPALPRTFSNVSASAGALFDADRASRGALRGLQVGLNIGRAYRTPDFNELYSNGPHLAAFSYDVGNPSLGAESGLGVDLFARLSRARVRGEVAAFSNRMRGFIFPRNTGDIGLQGNRPKFQYTGRDALLTGAEGAIETTLGRGWTADASASYVRGAFRGAIDLLPADSANGILLARAGSRAMPLMPPLHGHVRLQYERGRASSRSLSGGVTMRGGAPQRRLGDFETESAGYALVELNVGTRVLVADRFHAITLRLDNALNQSWRNHLSRTKDVRPEAGRNLSLLYRVSF